MAQHPQLPLNKQGAAIRAMFASVARRYDLLNRLLSFTCDRRWRKFAARVSGLRPGMRVLDVCAGTGDLAIAYAEAMDGGMVVATDFCHEMLKLARPKLETRNLADCVRVVEADALCLPFPDGAFDVSTVAFGIRNVADLDAGIREMARVVKPGGRVVILEFAPRTATWFHTLYKFYMTRVLPVVGRVVSGSKVDAYRYLTSSVLAFADAAELRRRMETCGLANVTIHPKTFGIVSVLVAGKRLSPARPGGEVPTIRHGGQGDNESRRSSQGERT
ncbi:MAG: bifunctional demethylmenaquinone methyltransferase/2-methoxy-6-polyprenyl-1,4-benzoquinol methylase UbiE [Planctomycetes bacterium]|nr:bifunctional demethylmenaquinone methyltransferase/2-methoxy-6-polyprenyl-1,4-benzoquinol methylase UbiE [Planctomycetota bacterium]